MPVVLLRATEDVEWEIITIYSTPESHEACRSFFLIFINKTNSSKSHILENIALTHGVSAALLLLDDSSYEVIRYSMRRPHKRRKDDVLESQGVSLLSASKVDIQALGHMCWIGRVYDTLQIPTSPQ